MALIAPDYALTAIATDVKAMDSLGYYLGQFLTYIDTNDRVRVMKSLDDGITWTPLGDGYVNNAGPGSPITGSGCLMTCAQTFNQVTVMTWDSAGGAAEWKYVGNGNWVPYSESGMSGFTSVSRALNIDGQSYYMQGNGIFGPQFRYTASLSSTPFTYLGNTFFSILWGDAAAAGGGSASGHEIIQLLAPAIAVVTTSFDPSLGESGEQVAQIQTYYTPPNPTHIPPLSGNTTVNFLGSLTDNWVGYGDQSHFYEGILSYPGSVGGVSSGTHQFLVGHSGTNYGNHAVFSSDGTSDVQIADRGLRHPHQIALSCQIDGTPFCFFVDASSQFGSTYAGSSSLQPDSAGVSSTFGRAKSYGTGPIMTQGWTAPIQSGSLSVVLLGTGTPGTLYTMHDPKPTDQNLPTNVFLLSEVTDDEIYRPSSSKTKIAKYDINLLRQACADTSTIPNPDNSPGSSPILRELLEMSGLTYSVVREMANDGQASGHQGGNAVDITGDFNALTKWAYAFAGLFAAAMWVNPDPNQESLYIWDGAIADLSVFPAGFETGLTAKMHLATSIGRLSRAFSDPFILAAMGVGPAQVTGTGAVVGQFDLGLFGDRYVYVNPDRLLSANTIPGTKVDNDPNAQRVDFW